MTGISATTGAPQKLSLKDLEDTVRKLRGAPPSKWLLVAPDGRVWAGDDPVKLAIQGKAGVEFGPLGFGLMKGLAP